MSTFIYTQNKYHFWYHNIINKAKSSMRHKSDGKYYELHHIVPRCMGGSDNSDNLVLLTAKEHFVCHHLLTKVTSCIFYEKLVHAFFLMCHSRGFKISSKQYEILKNKYSVIKSKQMKKYYTINTSPLKDPSVHAKTMATRKKNGSNVFEYNNPMRNKEIQSKQAKKAKENRLNNTDENGLNSYQRCALIGKDSPSYKEWAYKEPGGEWVISDELTSHVSDGINFPKDLPAYCRTNKTIKKGKWKGWSFTYTGTQNED